jgi:hypothetical protein
MVAQRLRPRVRRALLQAARRLRQLRLPGKPRRQLRADRLCLVLDQMLASRRLLLRPAQFSQPMGFYAPPRSSATRASTASRCARLRQCQPRWDCTLEPVPEEDRFAVRLGLRMVKGPRQCIDAARDRRGARRPALSPRSTISGGAPACRSPCCPTRRGRRFRPSRSGPPRSALGHQGAARRAAAAVRRRIGSRTADIVPEIRRAGGCTAADDGQAAKWSRTMAMSA